MALTNISEKGSSELDFDTLSFPSLSPSFLSFPFPNRLVKRSDAQHSEAMRRGSPSMCVRRARSQRVLLCKCPLAPCFTCYSNHNPDTYALLFLLRHVSLTTFCTPTSTSERTVAHADRGCGCRWWGCDVRV